MKRIVEILRGWSPVVVALIIAAAVGLGTGNVIPVVLVAAVTMAWGVTRWSRRSVAIPTEPSEPVPTPVRSEKRTAIPCPEEDTPSPDFDPDNPAHLVQHMLSQGRAALLLRPQIASTLTKDQLPLAVAALDKAMGIVPEGDVLLQSWRDESDSDDQRDQQDRLVHVEALYLDRYTITNREFQRFVDDGGYEHMSLWDPKIWPAVLDFVDRTGHPGPRFWQEGHIPAGLEDHPVVGVCWYEACAFARWVGKRLPSDPEWVKAACWPVLAHGSRPIQRRYPWGDTMDRERANFWDTSDNHTVSVHDLPEGVSVGGVCHLIGNVWEWTTSDFGVWDTTSRRLETQTPMKSLRGGAFDTYFETQAINQFQSGESPVLRKHNIGFRCALALSDVVSLDLSGLEQEDDENEVAVPCGAGAGEE